MQNITEKAKNIAARGGYSQDRYSSWEDVAQTLLNLSFSDKEAEAIMRSKFTRWAADASDEVYGEVSSADLVAYLKALDITPGCNEVQKLVEETF